MGASQAKPVAPYPFYGPPPQAPSAPTGGGLLPAILGGLILLYVGLYIVNYFRKQAGKPEFGLTGAITPSSGDQTPQPVDGKTRTVISAASVPPGQGSDYGIQFWMYIKDWDYRFGQEKSVLKRISTEDTAVVNPEIRLGASDNTLSVTVGVYPTTMGTDTFTCTVENMPLQSWASVSMTVFQRNLDIYLNGRLVKSCVLPGVAKPAIGDIVLNDAEGFSGSICNVHTYPQMLTPEDAKAFFDAGTNCGAPSPTVAEQTPFMTLFGYTFRLSILNDVGAEIRKYTF